MRRAAPCDSGRELCQSVKHPGSELLFAKLNQVDIRGDRRFGEFEDPGKLFTRRRGGRRRFAARYQVDDWCFETVRHFWPFPARYLFPEGSAQSG